MIIVSVMMIMCISLFTRSVEQKEQESLEENARREYWPLSYYTDNTLAPLYGYPSPTPPSYFRVPSPTRLPYSPRIYVPPTTPAPPSLSPYTPPSSYYSPPTPKPSPVPATSFPPTVPTSYTTTMSEEALSQTRTPRRVR